MRCTHLEVQLSVLGGGTSKIIGGFAEQEEEGA